MLPAEISSLMKQYGERYSLLKTPRQLRWRPHQGLVGGQVRHLMTECGAMCE